MEREKPKKWDIKPNQKKGEWNVEIFESVKKPLSKNNSAQNSKEQLAEYNSDSENNQPENNDKEKNTKKSDEKAEERKNNKIEEYFSENEELSKEIAEGINKEEQKLQEINDNAYLNEFEEENAKNDLKKESVDADIQSSDDTIFQMEVDINDPKFMNYINDLQNIVADVAEKAENMQIDDKFVRNNAFDFTKTMKT